MVPSEFKYEFKDAKGNSLMYLQISSPDGGESGKVTLHFAANKDPEQYNTAIQECKNIAKMLQLKCSVENEYGI